MTGGSARHRFAEAHPATDGHFPGNAIIPGAVLLQAVLRAVLVNIPERRCIGVPSTKFLAPVRPGETLAITWQGAGDIVRFEGEVEGTRAISGQLRFGSD